MESTSVFREPPYCKLGSIRAYSEYYSETKQDLVKQDEYGSLDESDPSDDEEETENEEEIVDTAFQFYKPRRWASNSLNTLIRLLILRIPRQQLYTFE